MHEETVLRFAEPTGTMTFAEGLSFIERTRRQLDRFSMALPHGEAKRIAPLDEATLRCLCDELETDIRASLTG
jgi:hypothetical protein